mmetsp:Transcript_19501/g.35291  ORF Transcript_19501/g.35291 Transcript_19501/m.35291 type:complete len:500 (-) Transcript_19501:351-1850(-)|eukprot:CAMPEP_0201924388 /NCGR_PEP_ID=MMETSP0903-20130614/13100_1 /ASSEMBLY_ACC=CAM_ASM_000552 /TAXON_ID=420261 /ORGANISM="Thalassiosira antarctica, Strain CCMP982" /LENGTH=499 /DNA_ID=CAMNT_0048461897 /DNA_START=98 /DNA_END=1597 /DNA_ORIENTATION=-
MKFPLHLLLASSSAPLCAWGYLPSAPALLHHSSHRRHRSSSHLHYKEPSSSDITSGSSDNSSSSSSSSGDASIIWSVLANTERWISDTLDRSNKAANARLDAEELKLKKEEEQKKKLHFADEKKKEQLPRTDNPYARKEVSYVCEVGADLAVIVGGVFRRVREARELGESHGRDVEARLGTEDTSQPTTLRQTNVVVIPNCDEISKFQTFDKLIQAINQARRASRDFVLKKKDDNDDSKDWVVSINCAHLHPNYGIPTPEEQLASLQHEEEEGEVDVNLQEYKKRRDEARRSPYPSVIVEVQSTPPPDFGARMEEAVMEAAAKDVEEESEVTSEDVKKLEALFGMSAAKKPSSVDDPFYDALGEAFGNKEIISQTPLSMAQNWVLQNDPAFNEHSSTFTNSNTRHVDAAYEYIFHNLAMLNANTNINNPPVKRGQKSYVVLPNFVPTSATSFDRFAGQVSNIILSMPGLAEKVMLSTFHPEHVVTSTRAPVPIVVITWK